jgi:vancomycin resistance protein YoaR
VARSITPLWTSEDAQESLLIVGKIQNLRVALQYLNGIEIPKDGLFSFWAQLGRPTAGKGYVAGRELRQGCLIPSVGGGLCQLSNALYSIALDAGFEVIERHAHSQIVPGSLAEVGRDATVFWNYVDLRFRLPAATRIEAFLTATELVVQVRSLSSHSPLSHSQSPKNAPK